MKSAPIRTNVLVLVGAGYITLLVMFIFMVLGVEGMDASHAYEVVKGPLMALIGGSLAISKDLIPHTIPGDERTENGTDSGTKQT